MLNLLCLVLAITLELIGDASVRIGIRGHRPVNFLIGAVLVICYSMAVNLPTWSFSRTMGVYIAVFVIISQIVANRMLHEAITLPVIVGGVLIVSGGVIILAWRPA